MGNMDIEGATVKELKDLYQINDKDFYFPIIVGAIIFAILIIIAILVKKSIFVYIGGILMLGSLAISFIGSAESIMVTGTVYAVTIDDDSDLKRDDLMAYFDDIKDGDVTETGHTYVCKKYMTNPVSLH